MPERTRFDELAALTDIAAQVNCTQDLDEILAGALKTTLEVIGECAGEIFLVDEETGVLELYVHQGVSQEFVVDESFVDSGECLCGLAVRTGRLLLIDDMANHPARSREACLREGFESCIRLPLRARGQILGLLNIQSKIPRHFGSEDEELLSAIGNQIGIAIANAQLIDAAEQGRATLDGVMRSMVDGLMLVDRRGKIAYANPGAEEMLGLSTVALMGQPSDAVLRELSVRVEQPEEVQSQLRAAVDVLADAPSVEFTLTAPEARTLQARFFPIQDARESLGFGLLLHDITQERELDRMKSQLLSTVSHELRTPLASIKGFATTLLRDDVNWDEESRREFLSIIDNESDRLSELISNLLDMSRIEAGTLRMEPEAVDLAAMVRETVDEFGVMTRDHGFKVDAAAGLPLVWVDPRRARQVLRNLVENAVKYSPYGGPIDVSVQVVERSVRVSVADRGLGIDPQHADRIFERFYQVDSASTRKVGGTGLGLSICKAIVEAHDGQIWFESEPGAGSTFHFTLPQVLAFERSV